MGRQESAESGSSAGETASIREREQRLARELRDGQKVLTAIGDETRQHIILQMIAHGRDCSGMRVPETTRLTHLSRPAVSHHLQILREAGIVSFRREGTKNYYFFTAGEALQQLITTLGHADELMRMLPGRGREELPAGEESVGPRGGESHGGKPRGE